MSWIRNAGKKILLRIVLWQKKLLYDFYFSNCTVYYFWPSKQGHLLSRKYVLTFYPLIHVLNSKNPNVANNVRTPKQFQFPTFYLLRSGIQDRIVAIIPVKEVVCRVSLSMYSLYHIMKYFSANSNRIFSWANTPSASYLFTVASVSLVWLVSVWEEESVKCAGLRGWRRRLTLED